MASFRLLPVPFSVLSLLVLLLTTSTPVVHSSGRFLVLVNYEFEDRVPPNNTVVVSATPSGNLSQSEFGTLRVVTNVLRESLDPTSRVLGSVVGLVNTLRGDVGLFLTFNFVYETEEWNGTLAVQGKLDAGGQGELAVTGGSGDFRLARGWCDTTVADDADPTKSVVFKNVLHLVGVGHAT